MYQNICNFLPKFNNYNFFNVINAVYETRCPKEAELKVVATHRMYMITDGEGILRTEYDEELLKKGDVIVMPPSRPFAVENTGGLIYIYISYLGIRANMLAEDYRIGSRGSVYHGYDALIPMWYSTVEKQRKNASVCCEGVVLYTFSEIGNGACSDDDTHVPEGVAYKLRDLIDKCFTESDINLERLADELNYHPKYLSAAFHKEFKVSINNYIRTLRVQHACTLIEQGLTSVQNISSLCGYNDPLYFSTVFKRQMGISPKEYIATVMTKRNR
ncbi:MAG: AraC family transcriptional regulator [Clostridia bacterium]|nr:AraC family transcriptional regulator [Clostridia bacterium]